MDLFKKGIKKEQLIEGVFILIDKPWGWSSFDVVNKVKISIKHKFKEKKLKVGHAGTLDPLAEGLVVIGTGKKTKQLFDNQQAEKEYIARIQLGETTKSFDLETTPEKGGETDWIGLDEVEQSLTRFRGAILQEPPLFSAKWVDGERAYELARKGSTKRLEAVEIHIHELEVIDFQNPELLIRILCSKGTYIRSLAHDIGQELGCGAYLSGLKRIRSGNFLVKDALSITDFEQLLSEIEA
jgi:tRNA pseudouridine55 synthase